MPIFTLKRLPVLCGTLNVQALHVDGQSDYEQFWNEHRSDNFTDMLVKAETRLREAARLMSLPKEKWKDITPKKVPVKEYEAKADDIRIYCFKLDGDLIITNVSIKTEQNHGIARMRTLKAQYLQAKAQAANG